MTNPVDDQGYLKYYDDEEYLMGEAARRFLDGGGIHPVDFYMMILWKSPRRLKVQRDRLKGAVPSGTFAEAVEQISHELLHAASHAARLELLMGSKWKFYLPTATAILTLLYPDDFTVYDWRVRMELGFTPDIGARDFSDALWAHYLRYKDAVLSCEMPPGAWCLRQRDRYLIGKSYRQGLERECQE